ncbi:MAG: TolC family protein [Chitinophagaceae bacterium]
MNKIVYPNMCKQKMMKTLFLTVGLIFGISAWAQQDSLTVEEAVAVALRNNYDILLSRNDSAIASINYAYINAAFYPRLNATGTYLFNNNAQTQRLADGAEKTRTGITSSNLNAAINLNWVVFDGFKMFVAREQLAESIRLGNLIIKNQVVNTVSDVIKTYYDIVRQTQQLRNIREQQQLSADRLRIARYRFDIGVGIKTDVLQAQIDFNTQKAAELNQLNTIAQRKQDLNLLMNVRRDVDYKVTDSIPVRSDLALGTILNNITETSPALQIANENIDVARLAVRSAKADRFPTVALTSAYSFSKVNNNAVINPLQPLFNLNKGLNYGFTVSVPILNNFTVRRQIQQAQLAVNFQQLRYESLQAITNRDVQKNYSAYAAQQSIITVTDSIITYARENLMIQRERYRLGATTIIDLRTAEQNLENAITTYINARYSAKIAETELLRLRGEIIK